MRQEVVLFHSALGLRPAVSAFADQLRAAGHVVHTPDFFDGEVFDTLADGIVKRDRLGVPELIARAQSAVADLPPEIVLAGFSMGTGAAEFLAGTRPGARGVVLMHGAFAPVSFGIDPWPHVPVQAHYASGDPGVDVDGVAALESAARAVDAPIDVHIYDRGGHLFEDSDYEGYDARSAQLMMERVLEFLVQL
jgi:dienelactone hydrolase